MLAVAGGTNERQQKTLFGWSPFSHAISSCWVCAPSTAAKVLGYVHERGERHLSSMVYGVQCCGSTEYNIENVVEISYFSVHLARYPLLLLLHVYIKTATTVTKSI